MAHQHEGFAPHHPHGDTPTQILMAEHEVILQALDALQKRLDAMQEPTEADRAYLEKAVEFLRGFADTCHHGKEETLLFTRMGERGFPTQAGPIAVMLSEHQAGRAFIRGLAEAAARIGTDSKAGDEICNNGYGYITLLRSHIAKENQVLFPMADRTLSAEDQRDLQHAFERFETEETGAGVHERMLGLLAELQAGAH
jgi:hemerythrin-like domain-containing protein